MKLNRREIRDALPILRGMLAYGVNSERLVDVNALIASLTATEAESKKKEKEKLNPDFLESGKFEFKKTPGKKEAYLAAIKTLYGEEVSLNFSKSAELLMTAIINTVAIAGNEDFIDL